MGFNEMCALINRAEDFNDFNEIAEILHDNYYNVREIGVILNLLRGKEVELKVFVNDSEELYIAQEIDKAFTEFLENPMIAPRSY